MRTIWKYPLEITDRQMLRIPQGPRILTVQIQDGAPMLWAMVDTSAGILWDVWIRIYGTGNPGTGPEEHYIATFQKDGLVWHVFTTLEPRF